jgi:hypothetical protein
MIININIIKEIATDVARKKLFIIYWHHYETFKSL